MEIHQFPPWIHKNPIILIVLFLRFPRNEFRLKPSPGSSPEAGWVEPSETSTSQREENHPTHPVGL